MVHQLSHNQSPAPIAIATGAAVAGTEPDDLQVMEALRHRGIEAVHAVWDDPAVDWSRFALVVIRSTWDYPERRDAFLAWANRLHKVLNPLPVLRWNTDKHYLDDLARAGLPVIPSRFVEPHDAFEPPPGPFVIKPAVSCGAKDTARYLDGCSEALAHVSRLHASGRTVLVQPYLADIERAGEVAVLFLGGTYSHSIRRDALLPEPGLADQETVLPLNVRAYEATREERNLAERVMAYFSHDADLLYGRVDLIPGPQGEPLILEVELTEPALFLSFSSGGVERLANAIAMAHADRCSFA
jgi:glutathione synthase/RimK-type ligase-like ATP-grasp enzyme